VLIYAQSRRRACRIDATARIMRFQHSRPIRLPHNSVECGWYSALWWRITASPLSMLCRVGRFDCNRNIMPPLVRLAPPGQLPPGQPLLPLRNTAPLLGPAPQTGCQSKAGCPGRVNLVMVAVSVLPSFLHTPSHSRRREKIERLSRIIPRAKKTCRKSGIYLHTGVIESPLCNAR
jgi:hypothetical protein